MGNHINNIISLENDEKIIAAFNYANNVEDERVLVLASAKGSIKRTFVKDLDISKLTKATVVMKLSSDDLLVSCDIIEKNDETDKLCVFTNEGNGIIYPINQVSIVGKNAAGVKNLSLKNNEKIVSVFSIKENSDKQFVALFCSQGAKRIKISEIYVGNRTNQAKSLIAQVKNNPYVVLNALLIDQSDYVSVIDSDEH
jgi:topoisomerase-4 subunit A